MQVFKTYFKIIQKNLSQILIYLFIFLFFAVFLSQVNTGAQTASFAESKCNIAFINLDKDSKLIDSLKNTLSDNANFVDTKDNTQLLQDALFFREVEYIVRVPAGFTDDLLSARDVALQRTNIPDSTSSIYIDNIINKYLNTAKLYINNVDDLTVEQLVGYVEKDMAQSTHVELTGGQAVQKSDNEKCMYYYNYLAYSLMSILILGVASVMLVFNDTELKRRNLCAPLKLKSLNTQLILANIGFALLTWLVMVLLSFIMYGGYMFSVNGLLLLLNSFIFTLASLSIAFLIANLVKGRNAMSAAANVVALGSSFISGVFVPQFLLGKTVLTISSFLPTYWYVVNNNEIVSMTLFNNDTLMLVLRNMAIILGFAVVILALSTLIIKKKRVTYN